MAKRLEQTLGHNECCSVPSPRWFSLVTYVKDILSLSTKTHSNRVNEFVS